MAAKNISLGQSLPPMLPPDKATNGLPACARGPLGIKPRQTGQGGRLRKHKPRKVAKSGQTI